MGEEITFNYIVEKPFTEKELQDFKKFRTEFKSLLKIGKLKVVEKYKVFTFIVSGYTMDEKNRIKSFLKKENQTVKIIS